MAAPPVEPTKATATSRPERSVVTRSHQLVASFLQSQGYLDTLAAFKREAAAAFDGVELLTDDMITGADLRDIVADYLTAKMQALAIPPAPLEEELERLEIKSPLPTKITKVIRDGTNVLTVRQGVLPRRNWDSAAGRFNSEFVPVFFTSAVDRTLKIYSSATYELLDTHPFGSPILSISVHPLHPRIVLAGTMEGSLTLLDLVTREVKQKLRDHTKYIVRTAWSADGHWVASIGYDRTVNIYQAVESPEVANEDANALLDGEEPDELASTPSVSLAPFHTHTCKTNPEALIFLPSSSHLVFSARDDHILHYIKMPTIGTESSTDYSLTGYNLNENGDAWVSFSVLYITLHPLLPLLCLQTSTENSRLLLYPFHSSRRLLTLFTTAEQSEFTTPRHCWLPDGTGVLVNSEDGVLRVVDLQGKVRARIGAHGAAGPGLEGEDEVEGRAERVRLRREVERGSSVVKDVAVLEKEGRLVFVSCGFDKTVKVVEGSD